MEKIEIEKPTENTIKINIDWSDEEDENGSGTRDKIGAELSRL